MTSISPHTTRANGTVLSATIYNADHTNHVANAQALNAGKIEGATPPVVDGHGVVFDGTSGSAVRSLGSSPVTGPAVSVLGNVPTFAGTTGDALVDSGVPIAQLGLGTRTDIASAATTSLATVVSHNANVTGTTNITSFGTSGSAARPIYLVRFAGALQITHHATSLICPDGASIQTAANDYAWVEDLGSNNWRIFEFVRTANALAPAPGVALGLVVRNNSGASTTQIDVDVDYVLLRTTTGKSLAHSAVDLTINAATTGANALDAGSLAASTWYNVWIISNGLTVAGLLSLSATAPTMPAGYVYKVRVGAVRTGGSSTFLRTIQRGAKTRYEVVTSSTTPGLFEMDQGPAGDPDTGPTWVALSISSFAPPTASEFAGVLKGAGGATYGCIVAPNDDYGIDSSVTIPPPIRFTSPDSVAINLPFEIILESTNIYWAATSNGSYIYAAGWTDKVNAN